MVDPSLSISKSTNLVITKKMYLSYLDLLLQMNVQCSTNCAIKRALPTVAVLQRSWLESRSSLNFFQAMISQRIKLCVSL